MLTDTRSYVELVSMLKRKMQNREGGANQRLLIMLGELPPKTNKTGFIPDKSLYNQVKWKFLLDAPFEISNKCCNIMKKDPAHRYGKQTGRKPMLATMAEESRLRTQKWLQNGCNGFDMKSPVSTPMAFWTEQDVLKYIQQNNIKICSVYGDIVPTSDNEDQLAGQIDICDFGLSEDTRKLKTTGCDRTGCMFCGFGCHLEKESRFVRMKKTHPKQYDYIMRSKDKGGLNYKEVIDWINEHGNLNIKY
jgi:3'-phosphoadenosine 5'-phosphosulfate sulfotransferase (PAPS reductase)/FAD synthetase